MQAKLQASSARPRRRSQTRSDAHADNRAVSPLAGKLRDETGDLLTPTHTQRRGKRYRYYVSNRLVAGRATAADASGWRLPAPALEEAVAGVVADHVETKAKHQAILARPDASTANAVQANAAAICSRLRRGDDAPLRDLIASGEIGIGQMTIALAHGPLAVALSVTPTAFAAEALTITAPFELRRRGVETRIIAGAPKQQSDKMLIQRLAEAHRWVNQLRAGVPPSQLSACHGRSDAYIRTRAQLAFLSPRIQAAILDGTQPPGLCLEQILRNGVPLDWAEQQRVFGINS